MRFQQGAGFRICGSVVRLWSNDAGTFATMTLDVMVDGRARKIDLRAFREQVEDLKRLRPGAVVEVTGQIEMEKLAAKDKTPIKVNGYEKWFPALTVKTVKTEASSTAHVSGPAKSDGLGVAPQKSAEQIAAEKAEDDAIGW